MSIIDTAKSTLLELPISDVLKERLSLALDQSAAFKKQVSVLQSENADLKAELKIVSKDKKKKEKELQNLKDLHHEEIRIHKGIEFRKGRRTQNTWMAFCPKCHCPAMHGKSFNNVLCTDEKCKWGIFITLPEFERLPDELK